jgi:hypothetical protein
MEQVLNVYERPFNKRLPVIGFDERPCQLIADIVQPLPMKPGQVERYDYHYQRNGTCCVFIAVEPLAGRRIIDVRERKTKKDYALFMKQLSEKYPEAERIILIQDNLNTHSPASFYEAFPADEAFALAQRFEMIYTPKKASWLNMAEIELSALARQCLDRRIGDMGKLAYEAHFWAEERNRLGITINWNFTKNKARNKFNRFYETIKN